MIQPMKGKVLIKVEEAIEVIGGIILPDEAKEQPRRAEVMAVGKDVKLVEVGDTVYFTKYTGAEISDDEIIMDEEDLLAKEEK